MPRRRRQPERQKKQRLDKAKQTTTRFFVHLLTARVPLEYALFPLFVEDVNKHWQNSVPFLILDMVDGNSAPEEITIITIEIEKNTNSFSWPLV